MLEFCLEFLALIQQQGKLEILMCIDDQVSVNTSIQLLPIKTQ